LICLGDRLFLALDYLRESLIVRKSTTIEGIKLEAHNHLQQAPKPTVQKQQKKKAPKLNSPPSDLVIFCFEHLHLFCFNIGLHNFLRSQQPQFGSESGLDLKPRPIHVVLNAQNYEFLVSFSPKMPVETK